MRSISSPILQGQANNQNQDQLVLHTQNTHAAQQNQTSADPDPGVSASFAPQGPMGQLSHMPPPPAPAVHGTMHNAQPFFNTATNQTAAQASPSTTTSSAQNSGAINQPSTELILTTQPKSLSLLGNLGQGRSAPQASAQDQIPSDSRITSGNLPVLSHPVQRTHAVQGHTAQAAPALPAPSVGFSHPIPPSQAAPATGPPRSSLTPLNAQVSFPFFTPKFGLPLATVPFILQERTLEFCANIANYLAETNQLR